MLAALLGDCRIAAPLPFLLARSPLQSQRESSDRKADATGGVRPVPALDLLWSSESPVTRAQSRLSAA